MITREFAFYHECEKRMMADYTRLETEKRVRVAGEISKLHEDLRASDVSWAKGESIRGSREVEIRRSTLDEERDRKYLDSTVVVPVVSIDKADLLIGTIRTTREAAQDPRFRVLVDRRDEIGLVTAESPNRLEIVETALFSRVIIAPDKIAFETDANLEQLDHVQGFQLCNGHYRDHLDRDVYVHEGEKYLAGSKGNLVASCVRCGFRKFVKPRVWFVNHASRLRQSCDACRNLDRQSQLEIARMDQLEERWLPFWGVADIGKVSQE